jgi:hypothetical protein
VKTQKNKKLIFQNTVALHMRKATTGLVMTDSRSVSMEQRESHRVDFREIYYLRPSKTFFGTSDFD